MSRRNDMWVIGRLLFGRESCMYAPCKREANHLVAISWVQFGSPPEYRETEGFSVFPMCQWHWNRHNTRKRGMR